MSPGQRKPPDKRLAQDRIVDQLAPDPGSHQPLTMLTGFLGQSSREGFWRLYLTPELDEYVEFAEGDVVQTEETKPEQTPYGGSCVWLRQGAPVTHTQVSTRQLQAEFLSGAITAGYMGAAAPAAIGAVGVVRNCPSYRGYCDPETEVVCRTGRLGPTLNRHVPACASDFGLCATRAGCGGTDAGPLCGTGAFVCGPSAGCTWGGECGYTPRYACYTPPFAC